MRSPETKLVTSIADPSFVARMPNSSGVFAPPFVARKRHERLVLDPPLHRPYGRSTSSPRSRTDR